MISRVMPGCTSFPTSLMLQRHSSKFLADLRVEGIPSEVEVVRSDNGGELNQGEFGQLCREINIKQEFTTADSPEYNGVAERGLAMIESAALAARIQASELFPGETEKTPPRIVSYQYRMLGWVSIFSLWDTRSGHKYYCSVGPT